MCSQGRGQWHKTGFFAVEKQIRNEDACIIKIHIVIEDIEFLSPRSISTCSNCSVDAFYSSPSLQWKDLSGHLLMKSPVLPRASPTSFSTSSTTCRQKSGRWCECSLIQTKDHHELNCQVWPGQDVPALSQPLETRDSNRAQAADEQRGRLSLQGWHGLLNWQEK